MATDNTHVIDQQLLSGLSGGEKLKILLRKQGGTLADWARDHGVNPSEIHQTLSGFREYPQHRDAIARSLGLAREDVDRLIDGEGEPEKLSA